jgi:putative two-component system response regulator
MTARSGERRHRPRAGRRRAPAGGLERVVSALSALIEARDPYTAGHMRRVADLAGRIAQRLHAPSGMVETVVLAGRLHDIGKNSLPDTLLAQRSPLSPGQRRAIQEHVVIAERVLHGIGFPRAVVAAIAQHHERLDGSGYPRGLADGEIAAAARILAVADTVEAMSHARPYRAALERAAIEATLAAGRGKAFDASVVDAALAMLRASGPT